MKVPGHRFLVFVFLLQATLLSARAAEYFVSQDGSDARDGLSLPTAFATIQKGVSSLAPGDVLTIGPGEYEEQITLSDFGDAKAQTHIRAAIPGTVLIRGDRDLEGTFEKVSGKEFTYGIGWTGEVLSVYETDTMRTLEVVTNRDALEFSPGKFYWDAEEKRLFLSSSDLKSPAQHHYRIGVLRGDGFGLNGVQNVVLEGLAASGFCSPVDKPLLSQPPSGFYLRRSTHCIVRDCTGFGNGSGITISEDGNTGGGSILRPGQSGGNTNVIEGCTVYGNVTDGVVIFDPESDTIRDSRSFLNGLYGFRFYGTRRGEGVCLMSGLLAWGNPGGDYWMKGNGLSEGSPKAHAENCISLGTAMLKSFSHLITGGGASHDRKSPDSINLPDSNSGTEKFQEFTDKEFADPLNQDFRLQGNSSLRASAPDGKDRGPQTDGETIRYVSPGGSDRADGRSVSSAWATLAHAVGALKTGQTLYLTGGRYEGFPTKALHDVRIRARGIDPVIIEGPVTLNDSQAVTLERLQFAGTVQAENSGPLIFDNCVFGGASGLDAQKVTSLTVRHGVFSGPLVLAQVAETVLTANIYAANPAVETDHPEAVAYSDYNSYAQEKDCWKVKGSERLSLTDLRTRGETHSIVQVPKIAKSDGGLRVENQGDFVGRGPLGTAIGKFRPWAPMGMEMAGPFLRSVTPSSANIEWWANLPGEFEVAWGDTPECKNRTVIRRAAFSSFTLHGLRPETKYHVKVTPKAIAPRTDPARNRFISKQASLALEFTTPASTDRAPATYHLSAEGSDANSGLSEAAAWQTLQHAADQVRPGDTVLMAGGRYPGGIYFRNSGEPGKPITFRAAPGEKVVIDGHGLKVGFVLFNKSNYRFDALNFEEFGGISDNVGNAENGAILAMGGSDLQITRCTFLLGWGPALIVRDCPDTLVQNSVFMHSMLGVLFEHCPNLRVENNVFIKPLIFHLIVENDAEESAKIANNIFGENTRGKVSVAFLGVRPGDATNNCFYIRWPETERLLFTVGTGGLTLPEVTASGIATRSLMGDPQMPVITGWQQGWLKGKYNKIEDLFSANPELIIRDIGLQPAAFAEYVKPGTWNYNEAWAKKLLAQIAAARDLLAAGKDAEAQAAFESVANEPMSDRLKAELLDEAALCAERLGNYDQAMALAQKIPVESLSARREMALLVAQGEYTTLLEKYADAKMGGGKFYLSFLFPGTELLMGDLYYYRAVAEAETGDMDAAEADLKVMIEKGAKLAYTPGVDVEDQAWLRLGNFYRKYRKDDALALEAYQQVIARQIKYIYRDRMIPKPPLLGTSETLIAATEAATQILTAQGKPEKVREIQSSHLMAQAEAFAARNERKEMLAKLSEAVTLGQIHAAVMDKYAAQIETLPEDIAKTLLEGIANSALSLSATARTRLLEAAADPQTKTRAIAILVAYAPTEKIGTLLEKAQDEAKKQAVLKEIEPVLVKLRALVEAKKWNDLVSEFSATKFEDWEVPDLAAKGLLLRARAHVALAEPGLAQSDLENSLRLHPDSPEVLTVQAENYLSNFKDPEKALTAYQRAHEIEGINYGWMSCDRALKISALLEKQGRQAEALAILSSYDLKKVAGGWNEKFVTRLQSLEQP